MLFTIIIPTTNDRGLLLPYSIGSVLNQTIADFELFVVGDGVNEETRNIITSIAQKDHRLRFFDYPKHARRGESYRHEVLTHHATGRYVAYLLDRDLWLPNHLATLLRYFEHGNLVTTTRFEALQDYKMIYGRLFSDRMRCLSATAHCMDLYQSLPDGWRTTPAKFRTDQYMMQQFLDHPDCNGYVGYDATILYIKRGFEYPGIPTSQRVVEMQQWFEITQDKTAWAEKEKQALYSLLSERNRFFDAPILVRGRTLMQVPKAFWDYRFKEFVSLLRRLLTRREKVQ